MADNQLYPVFEIPTPKVTQSLEDQVMRGGPLFDFETGDFVRDGQNRVIMCSGMDTYVIWVLKTLKTQYNACEAYYEYGIDAEGALEQPDRQATEIFFERTITEALFRNPITERVFSFQFSWNTDELSISFIAKPKDWENIEISMSLSV